MYWCCIHTMFTPLGVGKAEFVCGRVEDVLPGLMGNMPKEESSDSSVIAIADPPRGGLRELGSHF